MREAIRTGASDPDRLMAGTVCLVTGGSSGIGEAVCEAAASSAASRDMDLDSALCADSERILDLG